MGALYSKKTKIDKDYKAGHLDLSPSSDNVRVISPSNFDEVTINNLLKELTETPQIFVLNNLLMSVMFFDNFEKEKQKLIHPTRSQSEKDLNHTLLKDEKIECIFPDEIFDKVNKHIRFRPVHGANKNVSEPLVPKRYFVINDTFEVIESEDIPQYSAIDKPGYQVRLEDAVRIEEPKFHHHGYVKLRHVQLEISNPPETQKSPKKNNQYAENREPQPGPSSKPDDPSETYEYTTITDVKTPKPLTVDKSQRRDTLPKTCFITRKLKKLEDTNSSSNSDSEDDDPIEEPVTEDADLYETVSYISSDGFMQYFQNSVFPNSLGRALGFNLDEILLAKAIPGIIFCNLTDDYSRSSLPCEIMPSVAISWPNRQTYEFQLRDNRPTLIDKEGNRYRWPTNEMIMDLKSHKCVLMPRGFFPKRGENIDSEIEWEIAFPRAERYLDSRMSHAQVRCLLFILTLYRSFIEPVTKQQGLLVEHIRHHMYWECEANFRDWPEHRLGTKLNLVLQNLHERLSRTHLPNFFIKQKNVFDNIPNKYLKVAQKRIHDVLESPIIYFISALRNLRYTSGRFYPPLDFASLYNILTNEGVMQVNRSLIDDNARPPNLKIKKRTEQFQSNYLNYEKELGWKKKKERLNREKVLKLRQKQKEKEQKAIFEASERRGSVNSIDLKWECDKHFDPFKTRQILLFFTRHFIEIAKKCRRLSTKRQSLLYLKQAYYLAKILERIGLKADALDLLEIIAREEESSKQLAVSEPEVIELVPSTPKRNSALFNWDLTQQVNTNNIHLNNLNMTFNSTLVSSSSMSLNKIKRHPSNLKHNTNNRSSFGQSEPNRKSVGFADSVEMR